MADTEQAPKPAKVKLTPEQRREAVQNARNAKIAEFFKGKKFEYVGPYHGEKGQEYTDPSGNKGRNGHILKDKKSDEQFVVGPGTLKRGVEEFKAVTGYPPPKPAKEEKAAEASA